MRYIGAVLILLVGLTGSAAYATGKNLQTVPLPDLGEGPITLRVVRAINPRFPSLNEGAIVQTFEIARFITRDQYGLDVRFERGNDYTVEQFLQLTPPAALEAAMRSIVEVPLPPLRPEGLATALAGHFGNPELDLRREAEYLELFIPGATALDPEDLGMAVADVWVDALGAWPILIAEDGGPVKNNTPFHQHSLWSFVGYGELPFDIVMTNQLVASAQTIGFSAPDAMRGGMTMGFTDVSRASRFGARSMVSTFSMIDDLDILNAVGPDPDFDINNSPIYAAMILVGKSAICCFTWEWLGPTPSACPIPLPAAVWETTDAR